MRAGERHRKADQTKYNYSENCMGSGRRTRGKMEQLKQGTSIRREAAYDGCGQGGNWCHR